MANAAWYAQEDKYLEAGLSLISCVPIAGDAIGKGGKIAARLKGPALVRFAKSLHRADFTKHLRPFASHPVLGPKIGHMAQALSQWQARIIQQARKVTQACPPAMWNITPEGWSGNAMKSPAGRKMVAQFEAEGMSRAVARSRAQQTMESGVKEATRVQVKQGEKLYKLSAEGASPSTPFWMTEGQMNALRGLTPAQIADKMGLPPAAIPKDGGPFLIQSITAKTRYTGFESTIAPVTNGAYKGAGGGKQILVPGRSNFSPPSPPVVFR